jgi:hypothetical protein
VNAALPGFFHQEREYIGGLTTMSPWARIDWLNTAHGYGMQGNRRRVNARFAASRERQKFARVWGDPGKLDAEAGGLGMWLQRNRGDAAASGRDRKSRHGLLAAAAGHYLARPHAMAVKADDALALFARVILGGGQHAGLAAAGAGQRMGPVDKKQICVPCYPHFCLP